MKDVVIHFLQRVWEGLFTPQEPIQWTDDTWRRRR